LRRQEFTLQRQAVPSAFFRARGGPRPARRSTEAVFNYSDHASSHRTTHRGRARRQDAQIVAAIELLDQGATAPFIARYREEVTGQLDDVASGRVLSTVPLSGAPDVSKVFVSCLTRTTLRSIATAERA